MDAKIIFMTNHGSLPPRRTDMLFESSTDLGRKAPASSIFPTALRSLQDGVRLTVMRDGENVGVLTKEEITAQKVPTRRRWFATRSGRFKKGSGASGRRIIAMRSPVLRTLY
jgi:hypothetical protein